MTAKKSEGTENPSFEASRDELAKIVQQLEAGGLTLEQSLALWERGEALAAVCQGWLDTTRTRLEQAKAPD